MRVVALGVLVVAVLALVTGNLDRVFPTLRASEIRSKSAERLHSRIRAAVVIIAAIAAVASSITAYVYR